MNAPLEQYKVSPKTRMVTRLIWAVPLVALLFGLLLLLRVFASE